MEQVRLCPDPKGQQTARSSRGNHPGIRTEPCKNLPHHADMLNEIEGPEATICPQYCDRQYVCFFRMIKSFPGGVPIWTWLGPGSCTLIRLLLFHCRVRGSLWIQMMSWTGADEMTWSLQSITVYLPLPSARKICLR